MEKTKIGLPVNVAAAVMFLVALFGGYTPALLVAGYILLCEGNCIVRRAAVKALAVLLACSVLNMLIGLLPDIVYIFESFLRMFGGYFSFDFLNNAQSFLGGILSLAKTVVLVLLAALALVGKSVDIKALDNLADKE